MGELSKTAKASMVKAPKKEQAVETTEEAIRQIRMERAGKIFVVRMDRIDKLLAAYDAANKLLTETAKSIYPSIAAEEGLKESSRQIVEITVLGE